MSPPVGPTGLAQRCQGKGHDEGPRFRVGASFGAFRTLLLFTDGSTPWLEQLAVSGSFEWRVSDAITIVGAGGALLAGRLGEFETSPGGVGSFSVAGTLLEQGEYTPFVQLSASAGVSVMKAGDWQYVGVDVRGGVVVGWTLWQRFTPYAVGRVFGGPVFWRNTVGTDAFHVQLGLGAVVGLPAGFDLFAEVIPLGEQRVSAGVGFSF